VAVAVMPEVLRADLIELRRCRPTDLDALMSAVALSQPELARWLPWADPMPTREAEREFLQTTEAAFDGGNAWGYFLFERASGELVGGAGLGPRDADEVEIGYWVRSDRIGNGYATAAAGALTAAAFANLPNLQRVVIRMDQANHASAAIPPKLGFTLEGEEMLREVLTSGHTGKGWVWARVGGT
jgi:RimJ/RimL family protein N-acetyltransferase